MGALFQVRLADWPLVVNIRLRLKTKQSSKEHRSKEQIKGAIREADQSRDQRSRSTERSETQIKGTDQRRNVRRSSKKSI
jgi:hypothetical protein